MSDRSATAGMIRQKVVIERTYRASVEELWELWTTKEGFGSWWGPEGFRVEVHVLEARVGGNLQYEMIAEAPDQIAAMKQMGLPTRTPTRARFTELEPRSRLAITHVIDFLPGVAPFDSTFTVDFFPKGETVRMVITLDPVHDEEFTKMQTMGFASQLSKLDKRFGWSK